MQLTITLRITLTMPSARTIAASAARRLQHRRGGFDDRDVRGVRGVRSLNGLRGVGGSHARLQFVG